MAHAGDGRIDHLLGRHLELVLHVDGARRDEGVDAPPLGMLKRFPRPIDVFQDDPREPGDGHIRIVDGLGDRLDGLKVSLRGDGKTGFYDIHLQPSQLLGQLNLLVNVHAEARGLLAIAQSSVKNENPFTRHGLNPLFSSPVATSTGKKVADCNKPATAAQPNG